MSIAPAIEALLLTIAGLLLLLLIKMTAWRICGYSRGRKTEPGPTPAELDHRLKAVQALVPIEPFQLAQKRLASSNAVPTKIDQTELTSRSSHGAVVVTIEAQERVSTVAVPPCSVCLDEFSPDAMVMSLPCSHIYHDHCILEWFKRSPKLLCPLCKQAVPSAASTGLNQMKADGVQLFHGI